MLDKLMFYRKQEMFTNEYVRIKSFMIKPRRLASEKD